MGVCKYISVVFCEYMYLWVSVNTCMMNQAGGNYRLQKFLKIGFFIEYHSYLHCNIVCHISHQVMTPLELFLVPIYLYSFVCKVDYLDTSN